MKKHALIASFVASLSIAAMSAAQAVPLRYSVTDLGTLGGSYSIGIGVSDSGAVTGSANVSGNTAVRAFHYSSAAGMVDVGTLGGSNSWGRAISRSGLIAGSSETPGFAQHAFLYSGPGSIRDLGTLGGTLSAAFGVNDAGQVTGESLLAGDRVARAFLYSDGVMRDLGTLGGSGSIGWAINDSGQVTGSASVAGNAAVRAFFYDGTGMVDLGTLAGRAFSEGLGINSHGDVVGHAWGGAAQHAFLYTAGAMLDLDTLGGSDSTALSVNDQGVVTGWSYLANSTTRAAFVYADGEMRNLQDLVDRSGAGWTFTSGQGINNAGQITGEGSIGGAYHAFLLTPITVPEPGNLPVMALGLALIMGFRRASVARWR